MCNYKIIRNYLNEKKEWDIENLTNKFFDDIDTITQIADIIDKRSIENIYFMLSCVVCMDICQDAHSTSCCGNVFCKDCITKWVKNKFNCPMCRKHIFMENLSQNMSINRIIDEYKTK